MSDRKDSILGLRHVTKSVERKKVLLDDISLSIQKNALVAIIGPSGAGKTTLLQAMSGVGKEMEGEVLYLGGKKGTDSMIPQIGYVPQENIIHENLTLIQMLEYAALLRLPKRMDRQEIGQRIRKVLKELELEDCSQRMIKKLSG